MNIAAKFQGLLLISFLFFTTQIKCQQPRNSSPNVILIMADDLGLECLSAYGSRDYRTPFLDQMAKQGLKYNFCISQPLCTPSRVKIMTGKYNYQNYVDFGYLPVGERTIAHVMKDAGYKTMIAGKWQLNGVNSKEDNWNDLDRPYQFGFDEYCLWWLTEKGNRYAEPLIFENRKRIQGGPSDYGPDMVSDYILDFISRNKDQSFFVYYPMILVHSPFTPTPASSAWNDPQRRAEKDPKYFTDMVEYMDKIVGKITRKLAAEGLSENTLVLFTGDNGTNKDIVTKTTYGSYPGGKGLLSDNGVRVPLVVSWPAEIRESQIIDRLVDFSDFYATLASITEQPNPSVGTSLFSEVESGPNSVFVHYHPKTSVVGKNIGRFVRSSSHKLYHSGKFVKCHPHLPVETELSVPQLEKDEFAIYESLKAELTSKPFYDFTKPARAAP